MANYDTAPNRSPHSKRVFTINKIDNHIVDHGYAMEWEKSYLCPCRNADTDNPRQDCPVCLGAGFAFLPPVPIQGLLQSMADGYGNSKIGVIATGNAILTTTRTDLVTYRDRLVVVDSNVQQSVMVKVTPRDVTHGISLRYDVIKITGVFLDKDIEGKSGIEDFDFDLDNNLFKPSQDMVGMYVSINMLVVQRYYCVDILRDNRMQYPKEARRTQGREVQQLPRKLLIRREDMYIPSILNRTDVATDITLDPKPTIAEELGGFFSVDRA